MAGRLTVIVKVRFTPAQLVRLDELARLVGRTRSTYLREAALGVRFEGRLEDRMIVALNQCAQALSTLARHAEKAGDVRVAEELQATLSRVHDALEELLR